MKPAIPVIRTTRLTLRQLAAEDAPVLHHIYQSEGVLQYFPNPTPPSLERVQSFISSQDAHWLEHGYGNWGIVAGAGSGIIGWVGLQDLPELNETEVGFLLDRPFWGMGYATEAARAALKFGFDGHDLDHIFALVHPENLASRRVIEKCGMVYTETLFLWGIELMRFYIRNPKLTG